MESHRPRKEIYAFDAGLFVTDINDSSVINNSLLIQLPIRYQLGVPSLSHSSSGRHSVTGRDPACVFARLLDRNIEAFFALGIRRLRLADRRVRRLHGPASLLYLVADPLDHFVR